MINRTLFLSEYTKQLTKELYATPSLHKYGVFDVPEVADRTINGIILGKVNIDTDAIKKTCRALGIPANQRAITTYISKR